MTAFSIWLFLFFTFRIFESALTDYSSSAHPELRGSSPMNAAVNQLLSLIPASPDPSNVTSSPQNGLQAGTPDTNTGGDMASASHPGAPITYQPQLTSPGNSTPIRVTIGELYNGQQMSEEDVRRLSSARNENPSPMKFDWLDLSDATKVDDQLANDNGGHLNPKPPTWAPKKPPRIILEGGEIFDPNNYAKKINDGVRGFLLKDIMPAHLHPDASLDNLTTQQKFHRQKVLRNAWQMWCARVLCCRKINETFAVDGRLAMILKQSEDASVEAALVAEWGESPSSPQGWAWIGKDQVLYPDLRPIDIQSFYSHQLSLFHGDQEAMLRANPQPALPAMYPPDHLIDPMRPQNDKGKNVKRVKTDHEKPQ